MSSASPSVDPTDDEVPGETQSPKIDPASTVPSPETNFPTKEPSIKKDSEVSVPDKPLNTVLPVREALKDSVVSEPDNESSSLKESAAPAPHENAPVPCNTSSTDLSVNESIKSSSIAVSDKTSSKAWSVQEKGTNKSSTSKVSANKASANKASTNSTTKKTSAGLLSLHLRRTMKPTAGADVIKSMKWVIFPDNKWIKLWDMVILGALFILVFILPYQIGISAGVTILVNIPWLVCNVFLNSLFFVDTFLYFFRAYYSKTGSLVLDLKKIRKRYLRTYFIPNFISVLPFTLAFYIVGTQYVSTPGDSNTQVESFLTFIQFASMLKLIRLTRASTILSSSDTVTTFRMKRNSQMIQLWTYVWLIVVVSHWFACIWSLTAFIEVESFGEEEMQETPNWIAFWAEGNAVTGGLSPLGWEQHLDRYVLSLFWAIQTITSIGYGNIVPVTRAEYFVACSIQLCAGVMWAYVIGGLVSVAAGMQVRAETYRARIDQANNLIHEFRDPAHVNELDGEHQVIINSTKQVAKRIRKYMHKQYTRSKGDACINTLVDIYPAFESLTPELQRDASVLVMGQYLDAVPYLSSTFMSQYVQSAVSMQCIMLEFASGELIDTENAVEGLGRGIFVFKRGCAFNLDKTLHKKMGNRLDRVALISAGMAYGEGKVLVDDDNTAAAGRIQFLTFSQVVFIPREAVLAALEKSELAWKECARWAYLRTLLISKAEEYLREVGGSE